MSNFSENQYMQIIQEIRNRIMAADVLSEDKSIVFMESTVLQIRKILELASYLSLLVNKNVLNHDDRNQWHVQKVMEALSKKTTIFFPFPCRIIPPGHGNDQPTMVPLNFKEPLTQKEFVEIYKYCGKHLHARHPLKKEPEIDKLYTWNTVTIRKIKRLLESHTIPIRKGDNEYTFLYAEIDFSNNDDTKPTTIHEYRTRIFDEEQIKNIFTYQW